MYRINQFKIKAFEGDAKLKTKLENILSSSKHKVQVTYINIVRKSIDAREKPNIYKVYTIDFLTKEKLRENVIKKHKISDAHKLEYNLPQKGSAKLTKRPVVIGFGPSGMFVALILAEAGYKPIVFERGEEILHRTKTVEEFWQNGNLNTESNVQFGEGGAGTFSDGKLNTQIKDARIRKVLETFVKFGAPEDILYNAKPHIGTDVLRRVVMNMRKAIQALGGEVNFDSKLIDIGICGESESDRARIKSININGEEKPCELVILALGHSSRDTSKMLHEKGMQIQQKPFSIGLRVEHEQELIDKAQYGKTYDELGAADYKLSYHSQNGRGVYSFCMCPGGEIIVASSEENMVVTNGMSKRARTSGYANSGILVDVRTEDFGSDDVMAGFEFQRKYEKKAYKLGGENYKPPNCRLHEFISAKGNGKAVRECLPEFAVEAIVEAFPHFGRKISGFDNMDTRLVAVETRSSSPIRIFRDEKFESSIAGIYPIGEGAGYAGGITSSAVDGIKAAECIIKEYDNIYLQEDWN